MISATGIRCAPRRRGWSLALLTLCLTGAAANAENQAATAPAISQETKAAIKQLIGDSMLDGQAYEYDRQLSDMIGPRLTGSANYVAAARWAETTFKQLGLTDVHTEEWTIPATWEPDGPAVGEIVTPVKHALHIYSIGWSPSTPEGGVRGKVIAVSTLDPAELEKKKNDLRGAVVLLDPASFGGDKPKLDVVFAGLNKLRSLDPAALLIPGGSDGTEVMTSMNFSGTIDSLPEAQIGAEDMSLIERLLESGPVAVEFSFRNHIRKDVKVSNVIGEIRGSGDPNSAVIVGAHLDSWQPGTGAQDNGTGAASVIEAARAIQSLHRAPRRTVRFILFGGEEEGLLGSSAYVRAHEEELSKIDAVLITDTGAAPAKGWYLMGREDEKPDVGELKPLLAGLGSDDTSTDTDFIFETDHAGFDVRGVPTLVLWNDIDKYMKLHHKASDTFDSVSQKDLAQGAATVAVTAYAIADSGQSFAKHLSAEETRTMLKKADHLEEYDFLHKAGSLP